MTRATRSDIFHTVEAVPPHRVAIVFGAGLERDGRLTPTLWYRVQAGAELFKAGKVEKLLLSGDGQQARHDEVMAMQRTLVAMGVPAEDLVLDPAGLRTYDTCYRARTVFQLSDAILVTQAYHLPRAIFLCHALGVISVGYEAQDFGGVQWVRARVREQVARVVAIADVLWRRPAKVVEPPRPIE